MRTENTLFLVHLIGLHHPLDGITNPEYTLLCFIQLTKFFCKEKKALAFNQDRCCHLALCLRLILFHCLLFQFHNRKSTFAVMHSDIKSFKSGLLHLTGQPNCKKGRFSKSQRWNNKLNSQQLSRRSIHQWPNIFFLRY
jgi:hypothetical protein